VKGAKYHLGDGSHVLSCPSSFSKSVTDSDITPEVSLMTEHPQPNDNDESVASDKLRGAIEIGVEIDEKPSRVYYLWSMGRLPGVYKDGRDLIGSKQALRRTHHNRARTGK
jgi:hypothetical protein